MKAIVIHEYGPPEVLRYEDVADPIPRTGEIRIKVHAATVNRVLDVSRRKARSSRRSSMCCRSRESPKRTAWSRRTRVKARSCSIRRLGERAYESSTGSVARTDGRAANVACQLAIRG